MKENKLPKSVFIAQQKVKHKKHLLSWAIESVNKCHRYLTEYDKSIYEYRTYSELDSRMQDYRNYDELRTFLLFNAKKLIEDNLWLSLTEIDKILEFYISYYKNDQYYEALSKDERALYLHTRPSEKDNNRGEPIVLVIYPVKEALEADLSIDYHGKDTLKRHLFKKNILADKEFMALIEGRTKNFTNYEHITDYVEYIFSIIESYIYPNYHYIDENDLKDIIEELAFENCHDRGFFSKSKMTIIHCRKNIRRNFVMARQKDKQK